ncbi:BEN domain-containing protein 3-like [Pecten maximus]|uniref:BEN domain-containing protein 3-like n=1 Tax=Pecten maximus TaxID=6579 RepID=UPI001457FBFD|nr:BEN domain-containing protein 3-like [Pecten maximus]
MSEMIGRKLDAMNRRQDRMEISLRRIEKLDRVLRIFPTTAASPIHQEEYMDNQSLPQTSVSDDEFLDIPVQWRFSLIELKQINLHSTGPGNFAKNICIKLYPELFGPDNLRYQYSFFGGGPLQKKELDHVRKSYLARYVLYFHPDVKDADMWKSKVVPKINEYLRRSNQRKE